MRCTNCGNELDVNAVKCEMCGTETAEESVQTPEILQESEGQESAEVHEIQDAPIEATENEPQNEGEEKEPEGIRRYAPTIKKHWLNLVLGAAAAAAVVALVVYVSKCSQVEDELKKVKNKYKVLTEDNKAMDKSNITLNDKIKTLNDQIHELKNGAATQLVAVKNSFEKGNWAEVIKLGGELHKNYNGSNEDKEAQNLVKQSQDKINEAKAAEEAKKAKGYETGITYEQLARTPGDFSGEKVKFSGKVVQVMESGSSVAIRLAVDDNYDTVLYGSYNSQIVSRRVLEDDYITIYGTSEGTISYESTLGGSITIPEVNVEKIDF